MTEAEWLAATGPLPMYGPVGWMNDVRKILLFAAGCDRRLTELLSEKGLGVVDPFALLRT